MRSRKPKMLALAFVLSLSAILSGCVTVTSSNGKIKVTTVACQSFSALYWSKHDTSFTIAQIKEHNAAFMALCGDKV